VTANAGPIARSWGLSAAALTLAATLSPLAQRRQPHLLGWASDRLGRENTMIVAFTLQAFFLYLVVAIGQQSAALFAFTLVMIYFTWGEIYSLFPAPLADYFGTRNATSNYAVAVHGQGHGLDHGRVGRRAAVRAVRQLGGGVYSSAVMALVAAGIAFGLRTARQAERAREASVPGAVLAK
jgi:hypothetical protein